MSLSLCAPWTSLLSLAGMVCVAHAGMTLRTNDAADHASHRRHAPRHECAESDSEPSTASAFASRGLSHERLEHLEHILRPMYMLSPRSRGGGGGIDRGAARRVLDRFFLTRHAWSVRSLASSGGPPPPSGASPGRVDVLTTVDPGLIAELFEKFTGRVVQLRDLATVAAKVEDLVYDEVTALLTAAYEKHDFLVGEPLKDAEQEALVIQAYVLSLLAPKAMSGRDSSDGVQALLDQFASVYPCWEETMQSIEHIKENIKVKDAANLGVFANKDRYFSGFPSMSHLAEELIDSVGFAQRAECMEVRKQLASDGDQAQEQRQEVNTSLANFSEFAFAPAISFQDIGMNTSDNFGEAMEFATKLGDAIADDEALGAIQLGAHNDSHQAWEGLNSSDLKQGGELALPDRCLVAQPSETADLAAVGHCKFEKTSVSGSAARESEIESPEKPLAAVEDLTVSGSADVMEQPTIVKDSEQKVPEVTQGLAWSIMRFAAMAVAAGCTLASFADSFGLWVSIKKENLAAPPADLSSAERRLRLLRDAAGPASARPSVSGQ